jgi:hypothetical protein
MGDERFRGRAGSMLGAARYARRLATTLCVAAVVVSVGLLADDAKAQQRSLSARERALLDAASMEPIEVTLASRVLYHTTETTSSGSGLEAAENSITLRMPAAYVAGVRFGSPNASNRDVPGASLLTLVFWSRSFDPVMPDLVADGLSRQAHTTGPSGVPGVEGSRQARRRANGEYPLQVQIGNNTGSIANQHYNILLRAGLVARVSGQPRRCEFQENAMLGMLVGRSPAGERLFSACNVPSTGMVDARTGRFFDRATFLKRESDGTPKFGVSCAVFTGPDDGVGPSGCEMIGYFGIWPLFIGVPSDRVAEWDETFDRVRDHLARHIIARSDQ